MKLLNMLFATVICCVIVGCQTNMELKQRNNIMQKRINDLRHESVLTAIQKYNETLGMVGGYDPSFYTKETLKSRFDQSKFTKGSLHIYQASANFVLHLLMLEKDPSFLNLDECKDVPVFKDKASRNKVILQTLDTILNTIQDPDGRLKWFWEEPKCCDGNGTFFSVQPLLMIESMYSDRLPQEMQKRLRELLKRTYPVFKKETEDCSWTYVNPARAAYTFSTLLAEKFVPEELPQRLKEWKEYLHFLETQGIAENYTTTYLTVDTIILMTAAVVSKNDDIRKASRDFLDNVIFKQAAFFGNRFPAPYRRGYNGKYRTKRNDAISYLFGWTDQKYEVTGVGPLLPVFMLYSARYNMSKDLETA